MRLNLDAQLAFDFGINTRTRITKRSFQLSELIDLKLKINLDGIEQINGVLLAGFLHFKLFLIITASSGGSPWPPP